MAACSKIEWTDATWSPVTGCTKVSEGCRNCYAERQAKRFAGRAGYPAQDPFAVTLHPGRLEEPLHWRKPRRILVCSMGDLFHPDVPDEFIDQVFAVITLSSEQTFMILTKRPGRMASYICEVVSDRHRFSAWAARGADLARRAGKSSSVPPFWPLPNVWLGTSLEGQATADERIPHLLRCPAAVRFVSYEPALGPVDFGLDRWVTLPAAVRGDFPFQATVAQAGFYCAQANPHGALSVSAADGHSLGIKPGEFERLPNLDWVIAGGESGPRARPAHPDWFRSVRNQCQAAGVPFFFKQWGEWAPAACRGDTFNFEGLKKWHVWDLEHVSGRIGKRAAGHLLDGVEHNAYPGKVGP